MFVVTYKGTFGYIKPYSAVRDELTFSQPFLTPSIIRGIELKLFPQDLDTVTHTVTKIVRHKVTYGALSEQQEQTRAKGFSVTKSIASYEKGILKRGVMVNPVLKLAFASADDAKTASQEHVCLCRAEDVLLPDEEVVEMTEEEFNELRGFELRFTSSEDDDMIGFNRYNDAEKMFGKIEITGNPIQDEEFVW